MRRAFATDGAVAVVAVTHPLNQGPWEPGAVARGCSRRDGGRRDRGRGWAPQVSWRTRGKEPTSSGHSPGVRGLHGGPERTQ